MWMRATAHAVLALTVALLTMACVEESGTETSADTSEAQQEEPDPGAPREISRSDYGDDWPFEVESGILACDADAVTFTTGGTTYAVNGMASTRDSGAEIEPIWSKNPDIPGTRINIGPIIDDGLAICEE